MMRVTITTIAVSVGVLAFVPAGAIAAPSAEPFAIEPGSFHIVASTTQAGAHVDLTVSFNFDHESGPEEKTYNDVRTTIVNLPPGFIGNSTAVPACSDAQLLIPVGFPESCPADTQVGQISVDLTTAHAKPTRYTEPLYYMQTNAGVAATLGFNIDGAITQILPVTLRPGDSGLTITSPSIQDYGEAHAVSVTIWGVPASPIHNAQRGQQVIVYQPGDKPEVSGGGEESNIPIVPFLSNPTSCTGEPILASMESNSW